MKSRHVAAAASRHSTDDGSGEDPNCCRLRTARSSLACDDGFGDVWHNVRASRAGGSLENGSRLKTLVPGRPVTASAAGARGCEHRAVPAAKSHLTSTRISRCASISCGGGWAPGGSCIDGSGLTDDGSGGTHVIKGVGSDGDGGGGRDRRLYTKTVSAPKPFEIQVPAAPVPGPLPSKKDRLVAGAACDPADDASGGSRQQLKPMQIMKAYPRSLQQAMNGWSSLSGSS